MSEEALPLSKQINTLYSYDTVYSADSVEWCPHAPFDHVFVCGCYQLQENDNMTSKRLGRILLFSISPENGLILHQTIDTAAILDQKWCHSTINNKSLLGVVKANKQIEIYEFIPEIVQLKLIASVELQEDSTETLVLSLDWSTGKYSSIEPEIICSDSKGNIHLLKFSSNQLILEQSWNGHNFEAWIVGFYYWDPNIVFSGGDDSLFLKFDKRVGTQAVTKNRSHEAGVTSIHSNIKKEYVVATGSYDSYVRLWDMRSLKSPTNSIKMPGTLWRLKWDPFCNNYLLAACMLGGAHVIKADSAEDLEIVESYYEHKNISYGADWSYLSNVSNYNHVGNAVIGTCSFYDHLLCISKLKLDFS